MKKRFLIFFWTSRFSSVTLVCTFTSCCSVGLVPLPPPFSSSLDSTLTIYIWTLIYSNYGLTLRNLFLISLLSPAFVKGARKSNHVGVQIYVTDCPVKNQVSNVALEPIIVAWQSNTTYHQHHKVHYQCGEPLGTHLAPRWFRVYQDVDGVDDFHWRYLIQWFSSWYSDSNTSELMCYVTANADTGKVTWSYSNVQLQSSVARCPSDMTDSNLYFELPPLQK